MDVQHIVFRFAKEGRARFLSHRDLMRLFPRALRRAALPVRMSQGYNPHPRLSIPLALPLGIEAEDEVLEVQFQPAVDPADALRRLREQLPDGIRLLTSHALPPGERPRVRAATYEVALPPSAPVPRSAVKALLARTQVEVERRTAKGTRTLDIRPALERLEVTPRGLRVELRILPDGTPRPREVLAAVLGPERAADPSLRIRRTRLHLGTVGQDAPASSGTP